MAYPLPEKTKAHIFIPYNNKIADITHADTDRHTVDLAAALSESRKIIALCIGNARVTGTGQMYYWPNEGAENIGNQASADFDRPLFIIIKDGTQRLQYSQSVANDDWDIQCYGYVVEA